MNERPPDLKLRTKAFALRIIRMYLTLPKSNAVAQVLGRQVLRSGTSVEQIIAKLRGAVPKPSSVPGLVLA